MIACVPLLAFWGAVIGGVTSIMGQNSKEKQQQALIDAQQKDPWEKYDSGFPIFGIVIIVGVLALVVVLVIFNRK